MSTSIRLQSKAAQHYLFWDPSDVVNKVEGKAADGRSGRQRGQVAALPWRATFGPNGSPRIEILLISSRETGRWVVPKGWSMRGKTNPQAAKQEAYEEAGIDGRIDTSSIGDYHYLKRLKTGEGRMVTVEVFPLEVTGEHAAWPEMGQHTLQWMNSIEAALAVDELELRALIAKFARTKLP